MTAVSDPIDGCNQILRTRVVVEIECYLHTLSANRYILVKLVGYSSLVYNVFTTSVNKTIDAYVCIYIYIYIFIY